MARGDARAAVAGGRDVHRGAAVHRHAPRVPVVLEDQVGAVLRPADERAAEAKGERDGFSAAMTDTSVSSTWDIDHVRLTIDGHTLERSP